LLLLKTVFTEVRIPPAVHRELLAKAGPEAQLLDEALGQYLHVTPVPPPSAEVETAIRSLEAGEAQAIALAYSLRITLLIDEWLGRRAAQTLSIKITGIAGVLLRAKEVGAIPRVRPLLEEIRQRGYWLSDTVVETVTRIAGEEGN
jgi:uncharacterized protein